LGGKKLFNNPVKQGAFVSSQLKALCDITIN
jgi:hypothetical protein